MQVSLGKKPAGSGHRKWHLASIPQPPSSCPRRRWPSPANASLPWAMSSVASAPITRRPGGPRPLPDTRVYRSSLPLRKQPSQSHPPCRGDASHGFDCLFRRGRMRSPMLLWDSQESSTSLKRVGPCPRRSIQPSLPPLLPARSKTTSGRNRLSGGNGVLSALGQPCSRHRGGHGPAPGPGTGPSSCTESSRQPSTPSATSKDMAALLSSCWMPGPAPELLPVIPLASARR